MDIMESSPYPIWDWRNKPDDWLMSEELAKRGFELSGIDYAFAISRTFNRIDDYDLEVQRFFDLVRNAEIDDGLEPYKIILTDNGLFLHCLIL